MSILSESGRCPTCGRKKTRTSAQNSRYWALVREFGIRYGHEAEVVHEFFKRRFLPLREVEMPDWTTQILSYPTHNLPMHRDAENPGKPNWDDYTMHVEHFCAENGVYLQD